jgi:transcription elongation factor Elf1
MKNDAKWRSTLPKARPSTRFFCPQCDDLLLAPALSQHVHENLISHVWACENCGFEFKTMIAPLSRTRHQPVAA